MKTKRKVKRKKGMSKSVNQTHIKNGVVGPNMPFKQKPFKKSKGA